MGPIMTEQRITGKVALVTGSSRGIGRAIVLRFSREGADVAVNSSRDEGAARDVLAEVEASGRQGILIKANTFRSPDSPRTARAKGGRMLTRNLAVEHGPLGIT